MTETMLALLPLILMIGGITIVVIFHCITSILERNKYHRGSYFKFKD
jgi:hypothetical protein